MEELRWCLWIGPMKRHWSLAPRGVENKPGPHYRHTTSLGYILTKQPVPFAQALFTTPLDSLASQHFSVSRTSHLLVFHCLCQPPPPLQSRVIWLGQSCGPVLRPMPSLGRPHSDLTPGSWHALWNVWTAEEVPGSCFYITLLLFHVSTLKLEIFSSLSR